MHVLLQKILFSYFFCLPSPLKVLKLFSRFIKNGFGNTVFENIFLMNIYSDFYSDFLTLKTKMYRKQLSYLQ